MFVGLTVLALAAGCTSREDVDGLVGAPAGYVQRTVIAQVAGAVFGIGALRFYLVQAATTLILVLAANTAFNGFPILASILAADGYMPRQLARRGDRLVFSNGILILAAAAAGLLAAFHASPTRLIQLYILGVFVSFTLSQAGMVRHWTSMLVDGAPAAGPPSDPSIPGGQRVRRGAHAGRPGHRLDHQVQPRRVPGWSSPCRCCSCRCRPCTRTTRRPTRWPPRPAGSTLPSRVHAVVLVSRG